ncbi:MAG TPA: prolipoprotein diacylglyceryl transferase [Polyangiaceae bacterium]|jgi:prolipoprotein diacylglyceryl transferase
MLLLLPSFTWSWGPAFLHLPSKYVVIALGAIGALMALYGAARKEGEQITTGIAFLVGAGALHAFAGPTVELRYYSMLFVVVFLGGHALLNWQIKRGGGGPEAAGDFIVYGVVGVLVGARLGHVLFYDLQHAIDDPMWIFKIWTGGLASHGAVAGLIVAMYLFTKKRGVPFLEGADRFAFAAALGATTVRLGNLLNSEIVGRIVPDQSWGIRFPLYDHVPPPQQAPLRYPSQLYEIALGLFVMLVLYIADRRWGEKRPRGALISLFFAVYFTGRLFTEFYKEIEALSPDSTFSMGQYLSILPALLGWYGLYWSFKHRLPAGWHDGTGPSADDEDEDEDEDDKPRTARTKAKAKAQDEDEDGEEDEDEDERDSSPDSDEDTEEEDEDEERASPSAKNKDDKPASADPDVDSEFEDGKLKKVPRTPGSED